MYTSRPYSKPVYVDRSSRTSVLREDELLRVLAARSGVGGWGLGTRDGRQGIRGRVVYEQGFGRREFFVCSHIWMRTDEATRWGTTGSFEVDILVACAPTSGCLVNPCHTSCPGVGAGQRRTQICRRNRQSFIAAPPEKMEMYGLWASWRGGGTLAGLMQPLATSREAEGPAR